MIIINLINTATNLFGLIPLLDPSLKFRQKCLILSAVIASILMHLSETKHGLKGIYPFSIYSTFFLNLDRAAALMSGSVLLYCVSYKNLWNYNLVGTAALGLFTNFLSEVVFANDQHLFLFFS
jgi:hypothetical protein